MLLFTKILLSIFFSSCFSAKINICEADVKLSTKDLLLSYKVCTFETGFALETSKETNWFFLGTSFDDSRTNVATEGMYCDSENTIGFYQITNGILGNKLNRYDFNEMECSFGAVPQKLSVDRYMPNLHLKNTDITYFVSSGLGKMNLLTNPPSPFTIVYADNGDRLVQVTSAATKENISILFLISILVAVFI